ncbi:MAG: hypothetical protein QM647_14155 [Asticcacaulis sp.]|uniref:hypothetical protein n=1 Tax=Asticcacaulis sp. TaxID=1872648 RepID=UPI0039E5A7F7
MKTPASKDPISASSQRWLAGFACVIILSAIVLMALLIMVANKAVAAPAAPVTLNLTVMKEMRVAASDGTTKINLVDVSAVTPGDRLVYTLTYTNTGSKPVSDLVLNYPLPQGIAYRASADGSLAPQLSVDGVHFAPQTPEGTVTALRWQVAGDLMPGARGSVSFKATLN